MLLRTSRTLATLCGLFCAAAIAQNTNDYPKRPITIVVTSTAGSAQDSAVRIISARLSERLKQTIVVENRLGASGIIGVDHVAKAAPDGYTILTTNNTMAILPAIRTKLPFDVMRDFAHVSKLFTISMGLAVHSSVKATNLKELFALIKANPGKFTFASPGVGSIHHMGAELVKQNLGLDMVHIPHKDQTLALQGVGGGHVDMMIGSMTTLVPLAATGKVKILATSGATRSPNTPSLPTFTESGYAFIEPVVSWGVLSSPKKTPPEIIDKLNREVTVVLNMPEVRAEFAKLGMDPDIGTPDQTSAFLQSAIDQWKIVISRAGIKPE